MHFCNSALPIPCPHSDLTTEIPNSARWLILLENPLKLSAEVLQERLKEYVGHTPIQVVAGAILGIVLALVINNCY